MCFSPKIPKDNSAEVAAQKEAERQDRIRSGQASIDDAFKQFDDNYYNKVSSDYGNYYNPQVEQQYKDALDKLQLQLGQQGILQSSEGNKQTGRLFEKYGQSKQQIADSAANAANVAKQQVSSQKNSLYNQNNAAADPSQAASLANTAAQTLVQPQVQSPLGNLFAGLIGQGTNALSLQQGGATGGGLFGSNFLNNQAGISSGNSGSGKVVNG